MVHPHWVRGAMWGKMPWSLCPDLSRPCTGLRSKEERHAEAEVTAEEILDAQRCNLP